MMKNIFYSLIDYPEKSIFRGAVFRFPAKFPYEDLVEFLVFEQSDENRGFGLMVISGYKSGLVANILPRESLSIDGMGIDTEWLKENWCKWVYSNASPEDVIVIPERTIADGEN